MNKPYCVCDDCFTQLKKALESGYVLRIPKARSSNILQKSNEIAERDTMGPRVQGQLPRLSSVDSFSLAESKAKYELHSSYWLDRYADESDSFQNVNK